jgi:hypothetical protein
MTDHDFRYDRVLTHHHTHIYSLTVIIYTQKKTYYYEIKLHSLSQLSVTDVRERMVMHERTE